MTVTITITSSGSNTGPFNLHSDLDGYAVPFESGVARASLIAGYTTALVPDGTSTIRIFSTGECTNYIDVTIIPYTTTTSTSSTTTTTTTVAPTTTTTTTLALTKYCYDAVYLCGDGLHEIAGHEPFTGSVTYYDEFGVEHIGYYCSDVGIISVYSSSAPVTYAMTVEDPCPTTTTTTTIP